MDGVHFGRRLYMRMSHLSAHGAVEINRKLVFLNTWLRVEV